MRSDRPVVLSEHPDYFVVHDSHIPTPSKENIILKPSGIAIIARQYFQKYGVIIRVCGEFFKINRQLAEKIRDHLFLAKKEFPAAKKIGFILMSNDDPDDIFGHALPMIWEKNNDEEHLFFLDTSQDLGATDSPRVTEGARACRQALLSLMPNLRLWSIFGWRQIDYSSCYTDALVVLRDGLRVPSFKALAELKIKQINADITVFYAPELLLRTAQIGSFPQKSLADLMCVIRSTHKHVLQTLGEFRQTFEVDVTVRDSVKKFGTFTLFKAQRYAADIEREKLAKTVVLDVMKKYINAN